MRYFQTILLLLLFISFNSHASEFAAAGSCGACHQQEVKDWQQSHHALAMQIANDKTVLGDFNNASFNYFGVVTRFHKKNGKFYIYTQGGDGKYADFEVQYTFGVDPLQQYLVKFPNGKLQTFTISWDTKQRRWFAIYPQENIKPNDPLHWSQRVYNWNHFCADCHSTNLNKNFDAKTASYHTTFSAINVDCQACHGPAQKHVEWAQNKNHALYQGFTFNQKKLSSTNVFETCARCHARRHPITPNIQAGTDFLDNYEPETLRENVYYPDGGLQEEDYEYGSFMQSKMYRTGVKCTDCHNPHTLKLNGIANAVCTQCHNPKPPLNRFPTLLAKNYDSPEHHFHKPGSAGAQCISCHMPTHTYMQVDVRRDHFFRIPRPDLTVKFGTPNACNLCHKDKSAQWAADQIQKWYGKKTYSQDDTETFALGRKNDPNVLNSLIAITQDANHSPMARASAVVLIAQYEGETSLGAVIAATKDLHPLVRTMAAKSLTGLAPEAAIKTLAPLLNDPVRSVRIAAARSLANIPKNFFSDAQYTALGEALKEYKAAQQSQIDQPEGNLNLGALSQETGDLKAAENYYKTAIARDHSFYPASKQLAILYDAQGKPQKAIDVLKEAMAYIADQNDLQYSLKLLNAEKDEAKK